jgi:hypothetical protein
VTVATPQFLQTKSYSAQALRQMFESIAVQEGIIAGGDYATTQRGAGANMSVDTAAGKAFVQGDTIVRQGLYQAVNDAVVNTAVAAAHATLPRLDQLVLRVYDSTVTGSSDVAQLEMVAGTPTASASLANRLGAAALPASALRIADVLVPAAAASIVNANIGNPIDPRAGSLASLTGAPPAYAFARPLAYTPYALINRLATQSLTTGVGAALSWDTETADNDAIHDPSVNPTRLTCRTPGTYQINAEITFAANATGNRYLQLDHRDSGGVGQRAITPIHRQKALGVVTDIVHMAVSCKMRYGDYIEILAQQDSGGALNATGWADMTMTGP